MGKYSNVVMLLKDNLCLQLLEHCELIVEAIKAYQDQGRMNDVAKYASFIVG